MLVKRQGIDLTSVVPKFSTCGSRTCHAFSFSLYFKPNWLLWMKSHPFIFLLVHSCSYSPLPMHNPNGGAALALPMPCDDSVCHPLSYTLFNTLYVWYACLASQQRYKGALGSRDATSPSEGDNTWHTADVSKSHITASWSAMREFSQRRLISNSFDSINWRWRKT